MSNETQFTKRDKPLKTALNWLGLIVAVVTLGGGMVKAYIATPIRLEDHDKKFQKLESVDAEVSRELREQRDLLTEIRTDIKYLRRERTNTEK